MAGSSRKCPILVVIVGSAILLASTLPSPGSPPDRRIGDRIAKLIDDGKLILPDGVQIERIGPGYRDRGVIVNDEFKRSGSVASHPGVEAFVHKNDYDIGSVLAMNFLPTTGGVMPGAFLAESLGLGGGFDSSIAGRNLISSYSFKALRRTQCIDDSTEFAEITSELWDGDPAALVDTLGGSFANAPIPGTRAIFTGVPRKTTATYMAHLSSPVQVPNNTVWMTLTGTSCRLGRHISFQKPTVGNDGGLDGWEWSRDLDGGSNGLGTCCANGNPCGGSSGLSCTSCIVGVAGLCSDGDAEDVRLATYGGPCTGDASTDRCSTFVSSVYAPAKITLSFVPIGNGPNGELDPGVTISDHEITLPHGGSTVFLEIRSSSWNLGDDPLMNAFQVRLDAASLTSGLRGTLSGKAVPCTMDADCLPAFGGVCNLLGTRCMVDADCESLDSCVSASVCRDRPFGGSKFCKTDFISCRDRDYVFGRCAQTLPPSLIVADPLVPDHWAEVLTSGPAVSAPDPFPPSGVYYGTLVLDIPPDAEGTFTIGMLSRPNTQLLDAATAQGFPLLGLVPAKITVGSGHCCFNIGPDTQCDDLLDAAECAAAPGPSLFRTDGFCGDPGGGCFQDCNSNGTSDPEDIVTGQSLDCNANGIPDECEPDADGDGVIDVCEQCPTDPDKLEPGICGCGVPEGDDDLDTVSDCFDQCPGADDLRDEDDNGTPDCLEGLIPTLSAWGVLGLTLLLMIGGKILFDRRRSW